MAAPRLTDKVLRGLSAIAAAVEAGDLLDGDLADSSGAVDAALTWISRAHEHRHNPQCCQRCGRGIPSRRLDTGFCSDKCERQQRLEDRESMDAELADVAEHDPLPSPEAQR